MKMVRACVSVLALVLATFTTARAADLVTKASSVMTATRYADKYDGRPMKGGGIFRSADPTIAAAGPRGFAFGTRLRLVNPRSGRTLEVVVRDRGSFGPRHLDLSRAGAQALGFTDYATLQVAVIK